MTDPIAALAAEALALRSLSTYHGARERVEHRHGALSHLPQPPPTFREIEARYDELMRILRQEEPRGPSSEVLYLDLVEAIILDQIAPQEGPVMTDDEDLHCALQMIHLLQKRANRRDIDEAIVEERALLAAKDREPRS
jgi:hypothetical protein